MNLNEYICSGDLAANDIDELEGSLFDEFDRLTKNMHNLKEFAESARAFLNSRCQMNYPKYDIDREIARLTADIARLTNQRDDMQVEKLSGEIWHDAFARVFNRRTH